MMRLILPRAWPLSQRNKIITHPFKSNIRYSVTLKNNYAKKTYLQHPHVVTCLATLANIYTE